MRTTAILVLVVVMGTMAVHVTGKVTSNSLGVLSKKRMLCGSDLRNMYNQVCNIGLGSGKGMAGKRDANPLHSDCKLCR